MRITNSLNFFKPLALSVAFSLAACGGADTGDTGDNPNPTPNPETLEVASLANGLMAKEHAKEQGYWYSRYILGSFMMQSGNGETFAPDMAVMGELINLASDDMSRAQPPANAALLRRPYDFGNPELANAPAEMPLDLSNFLNFRWTEIEDNLKVTTSGSSVGQILVKAAEWAKLFHVDSHFGAPGSQTALTQIPGANQRFAGMVLTAEALMMIMDVENNPSAYDLSSSPAHAYNWLQALADYAHLLTIDTPPHSDTANRYLVEADMLFAAMGRPSTPTPGQWLTDLADTQYSILPEPTSLEERAIAIRALSWYGFAIGTNRAEVKTKIATYADALMADQPTTAAMQGAKVRGLMAGWQQTQNQAHFDAAIATMVELVKAYDGENGVFTNQSKYTPGDIAWIIGAINAVDNFAFDKIGEENINNMLTGFFESAINMSGLMMAAPPVVPFIPEYERLPNATSVNELFHRYPTLQVPPMAGATNGVAATVGTSVTWDGSSWTRDSRMFNTAQAFRLANEMVWLHGDEVDGFPMIP